MNNQSTQGFLNLMEHQHQKIVTLQEEEENNNTILRKTQARKHQIELQLQEAHREFTIAQEALALEKKRISTTETDPSSLQDTNPDNLQDTNSNSLEDTDPGSTQDTNPSNPQDTDPFNLQDTDPFNLRDTDPKSPQDTDPGELRGADTDSLQDADLDNLRDTHPDSSKDADPGSPQDADPSNQLLSQNSRDHLLYLIRQQPWEQLEVLEFIAQEAAGYLNINEAEDLMVQSHTMTSNNASYRRSRIIKLIKHTANPPWLDTDNPEVFRMPDHIDTAPASTIDDDALPPADHEQATTPPADAEQDTADAEQSTSPSADAEQNTKATADAEQGTPPSAEAEQDTLAQALRSQALSQDNTIITSEAAQQKYLLDLIPTDSPDPEGHIYQCLAHDPDWQQIGADTFRITNRHN